MRRDFVKGQTTAAMTVILLGFALLVLAQSKTARADKPARNLEVIQEKFKADKKLIVAKYMELTESEVKKFWPVYEEDQSDLKKNNDRLLRLFESYAADYKNKSLADEDEAFS